MRHPAWFLVTPPWLAMHLVAVLAVAGMVLLGSWQVERATPVDDAQVESFAGTPGTNAAELGRGGHDDDTALALAPGSPVTRADVGSTVSIVGRFDQDATLLVPDRTLEGQSGWLVMTPLRAESGVVPVVRGWVPRPGDPASTPPAGQVHVEGTVAPPEAHRATAPREGAGSEDTEVPTLSQQTLFLELGYAPSEVFQGLLVATDEDPGSMIARVPADDFISQSEVGRWRHLAYGAQWWVFAVAAAVFWGAFVRAGWRSRMTDQPRANALADA